MGIVFYILDRDELIRELSSELFLTRRHTESLNGESVLELVSTKRIEKYEHVIYQSDNGDWHEFVVSGCTEKNSADGVGYDIYAESVLTELAGDWIDDRRSVNQPAVTALSRALEGTRWTVGTVSNFGNGTVTYYRESAYTALGKIVKAFGGELRVRITVTDGRVTGRYIDLLAERGQDNGARFEWTRNMLSVEREVLRDDIVTALHGYGRGEEVGDGFGRRISFAEINGGLSYVASEEARRRYGRMANVKTWEVVPDVFAVWGDIAGSVPTWGDLPGYLPYGRAHRHGAVYFDDVTDKTALKTMTEEALIKLSRPQVTYSAKVVDFGLEPVELGDHVTVIDDDLGIESKLRVIEIVRDPLDRMKDEITLGDKPPTIAGTLVGQRQIIDGMRSIVGVSRLVSDDGYSWVDYGVPEIYLEGENGSLKIDTDTIFQLRDNLGRLVSGFTDVGGQKGLFTRYIMNSPDGVTGVGSVGGGTSGGYGYQFEHGGHAFMLTFDTGYGVQFYIDDKLAQLWDDAGGHWLFDRNGKARQVFHGGHGDMSWLINDVVRLLVATNGTTVIRDHNGKDRLTLGANGDAVMRDQLERIRLHLQAGGNNGIVAINGKETFFQDAQKTEIATPTNDGHAVGADATGPYYIKNGTKTYF